MGILKKLKRKRQQIRAKVRGLTVTELKKLEATKKRKEREERRKFEKWAVEEKYRRKRKAYKKGKGGLLGGAKAIFRGLQDWGDRIAEAYGEKPRKRRKKRR